MPNKPKAGTREVGVSGVDLDLATDVEKLARENGTSRSAIAREAWEAYRAEHAKPKSTKRIPRKQ
jgi:hypothetical protein